MTESTTIPEAGVTNAANDTEASEQAQPLLDVRDLKTYFPIRAGLLKKVVAQIRAVDGVSFHIDKGETLGLVGESGCGKSTVGKSILRLENAHSGEVRYQGKDLLEADKQQMHRFRQDVQMIFQDPASSLNPRMTLLRLVGEPLLIHDMANGSTLRDKVAELLTKVGLSPDQMNRYPNEFSGGQRQRIGIARALALSPDLIICDEPVSALDVSIQSQILNLLVDLREELSLTYLFIAHNLAVVEHFCQRVAVMYLGRIVEMAPRQTLFENPIHPYTKALLSAAPMPDPDLTKKRKRILLAGDVPSPKFNLEDKLEILPADQELELWRSSISTRTDGSREIDRKALKHRPPLVQVPGSENHLVSAVDVDNLRQLAI